MKTAMMLKDLQTVFPDARLNLNKDILVHVPRYIHQDEVEFALIGLDYDESQYAIEYLPNAESVVITAL